MCLASRPSSIKEWGIWPVLAQHGRPQVLRPQWQREVGYFVASLSQADLILPSRLLGLSGPARHWVFRPGFWHDTL